MNLRNILIKDYPCGSGKTTRMIKEFEPDKKYLVVVPYLSEVERVISESVDIPFYEPLAGPTTTKSDALKHLLLFGDNIVTTHKLFNDIVSLARQDLLDDYHIIIDEVPEVVRVVSDKNPLSIKEFYIERGFINIDDDTGLVTPTDKWELHQDRVSDTLDKKILNYAQSGCLYLLEKQLFIWSMPSELLSSSLSITILTYKVEGSLLLAYLKRLGYEPIIQRDEKFDEEFRQKAKKLITVKRFSALDGMNFSFTAQNNKCTKSKYCKRVSNALKNLRGRELKGIPLDKILITCAKSNWFEDTKSSKVKPKSAGFSKNSKMFGANWIANTTRGTNDYSHCSTLIYLHDQNINPFISRWLDECSREFKDAYALTELIQWIWRSRVRNGEPITLYLPSKRMRRLFQDWLNGNSCLDFQANSITA